MSIYKTKEYQIWRAMMNRCYAPSVQEAQPTYKGCIVCEEWKDFKIFEEWVLKQDYVNKVLDKDIIGNGKIYSPDTAAFVLPETNSFMTDRYNYRGLYPVGVHKHMSGKYQARCGDSKGVRQHLGTYPEVSQAFSAYLLYKYQISLVLAEKEVDIRVKNRLPEIFFNLMEKYYVTVDCR